MSTGSDEKRGFWNTPAGFALTVFLAAAAFYLWLEYRAHILDVLPLLIPLLICVGMHVFMHRGHGGDRDER